MYQAQKCILQRACTRLRVSKYEMVLLLTALLSLSCSTCFVQVMMRMDSEGHKLKINCQHFACRQNFSPSFWSASHDPHRGDPLPISFHPLFPKFCAHSLVQTYLISLFISKTLWRVTWTDISCFTLISKNICDLDCLILVQGKLMQLEQGLHQFVAELACITVRSICFRHWSNYSSILHYICSFSEKK